MKKGIIKVLNHPVQKLTIVDEYIQKKINVNTKEVIKMNIKELAIFCNCSAPTVSRFIKKFGFKKFTDFKIYLNNSFNLTMEKYGENKKENIHNSVVLACRYSVDNAINKEGEVNINKTAEMIVKSKKILLAGMGSSFNACDDLCANLEKIRIDAYASRDLHRVLSVLSSMGEDDLMIVFSNRAINNEINFLIGFAKMKKIKIILITSNQSSKYINSANITITHSNEIQNTRVSALSSKVSQSIIGDSIFRSIVFNDNKYHNFLINSKKIILEWEKQK